MAWTVLTLRHALRWAATAQHIAQPLRLLGVLVVPDRHRLTGRRASALRQLARGEEIEFRVWS